jgi:hypothetical protein
LSWCEQDLADLSLCELALSWCEQVGWLELAWAGVGWSGVLWVCLKWRWPDGVYWAGPAQTINVSKKLRMNLFILEEKTKKYDYII